MLNIEAFKYEWTRIPKYFIRCLCLKKSHQVRQHSKSDFYLNKGIHKLNTDLDVIEIVKMRHIVEIIKAILFSKFHKDLLGFQNTRIMNSSTEESEIEHTVFRKRHMEII